MSDPSSPSSPCPDWGRLAALLGAVDIENDAPPTEAERREHQAKLAELRQAQAGAVRRHKAEQVRALLKEHNRRKAGEPWTEPGEPI
jgi:hypothetical protein